MSESDRVDRALHVTPSRSIRGRSAVDDNSRRPEEQPLSRAVRKAQGGLAGLFRRGSTQVRRDRLDGHRDPSKPEAAADRVRTTDAHGSATLAHLHTDYVGPRMKIDGTFQDKVNDHYYLDVGPEDGREHAGIYNRVVAAEQEHAGTHVAFYRAQHPDIRIEQDVYRRIYQIHRGERVPENFHFLRYPGPEGREFREHRDATAFLEGSLRENGLIHDWMPSVQNNVVAANLSLHGNFGRQGEDSFDFFEAGMTPTSADGYDLTGSMRTYLEKFGYDTSDVEDFVAAARQANETQKGTMMQILIPKDKVDRLAYVSQIYGMPHDDAVLEGMTT
jgi:hypothetical protein